MKSDIALCVKRKHLETNTETTQLAIIISRAFKTEDIIADEYLENEFGVLIYVIGRHWNRDPNGLPYEQHIDALYKALDKIPEEDYSLVEIFYNDRYNTNVCKGICKGKWVDNPWNLGIKVLIVINFDSRRFAIA